jgi:hypothetical protein
MRTFPTPPVIEMRVETSGAPHVKPPLGVVPRHIWESVQEHERLKDIKAAISRYLEAGSTIPIEWITEYNELVRKSK